MTDYHAQHRVDEPDCRRSGLLLAAIAAGLYALTALQGAHHPGLLAGAAVVAVAAWFRARPLRLVIVLLIRIGNVMHRFTNPLVFGLVYLVAVTPTALILRLLGKDPLHLRLDRNSSSYWLPRPGDNDWQDGFKNQY